MAADISKTIHGSLVSIFDRGILIVGEPGSGKSTLCLGSLRRGHKLVADDAVELTRAGGRLTGKAPEIISGLIEIRDVGIVDVREICGRGRFRPESTVDLCVKLVAFPADELTNPSELTVPILGIDIPLLTFAGSITSSVTLENAVKAFRGDSVFSQALVTRDVHCREVHAFHSLS